LELRGGVERLLLIAVAGFAGGGGGGRSTATMASRRRRVGFDDVDAKHPNTGVSVGEDIKNNASIRGKSFGGRWRGDRRIAAAAARMRRWRRRAKGKGMMAPNQHRRGKGRMTMASPEE